MIKRFLLAGLIALAAILWLTPDAPYVGPAVSWITPGLVATTGNLTPNPRIQYFDNSGAILAGAKLCFYAAGTTTPLAPSSTANMLTPTTNPVVLDSAGRLPSNVYLGPASYKEILYAAASTTTDCVTGTFLPTSAGYWTADNIQGAAGTDASVLSSGNLPWAQLPVGSGTWTGTPTITGAVSLNSTLTVAGATTISSTASNALSVLGGASFGAGGLVMATSGVITSSVQPRVSAYNNTTQSVPDTTVTALTMNSEDFQVGTSHSTSSNTSRFVATSAGVYLACGGTSFAANATGVRQIFFRKNGTTLLNPQSRQGNLAATQVSLSICVIVNLALNDYLELMEQQTSTGNLNVGDTAAPTETNVQFMRIW